MEGHCLSLCPVSGLATQRLANCQGVRFVFCSKKQLAKRKEVLEMAQTVLTSQDAEVKTLR